MRDKPGEPEDHGDGLDGQDRKGMCGPREEAWREGKEGDDEKGGPYCGKDEEVDAVRGGVVRESVGP